jgi:hypothetical protein
VATLAPYALGGGGLDSPIALRDVILLMCVVLIGKLIFDGLRRLLFGPWHPPRRAFGGLDVSPTTAFLIVIAVIGVLVLMLVNEQHVCAKAPGNPNANETFGPLHGTVDCSR